MSQFMPDEIILDEPGMKKQIRENARKLLIRGWNKEQFNDQDQKSYDLVLTRAKKGEFGLRLKIFAGMVENRRK